MSMTVVDQREETPSVGSVETVDAVRMKGRKPDNESSDKVVFGTHYDGWLIAGL